MATRKAHQVPVPGTDRFIKLWGDPVKLAEFFEGIVLLSFQPDTYTDHVVGPQTRRMYPGDPGISVAAHTRKVVTAPNVSEATLPGQPFTCETFATVNGKQKRQATQFTVSGGPFRDLLAVARAIPARPYILRSPGGKPKEITMPSDGGN
jgi:hypothetical protein